MKTFSLLNEKNKPLQNCICVKEETRVLLMSYNTHVATFDIQQNKMHVIGTYSNITRKHINAFLEFYGFDKCTKQEFKKYYNADITEKK